MSAGLYDHIVIGAGISGSSAAYQLAKRGTKVLLLEKVKKPNIIFKEEEEEDNKFLNNIIKSFDVTPGSSYSVNQGQNFHQKFPYLNMGDSVKGYFDPSSWVVLTAEKTLRTVQDLAVQYGAKIMYGFNVEDIKSFPNFVKVFGNEGHMYTAKSVVLCPGPWAGNLLDKVGIKLPLQQMKIPVYDWKGRDFMPNTPDKNPVIDTVPGKENVVIAVGFSGTGFKLGPMTGYMLADMAMGIKTRQEVELLSINRFLKGKSNL